MDLSGISGTITIIFNSPVKIEAGPWCKRLLVVILRIYYFYVSISFRVPLQLLFILKSH